MTANRLFEALLALGFALAAALFWKLRIIAPAVGLDPDLTRAGDLAFYVVPVAHFARESLLAGTLPLWNPYQFTGHPFLATALPGLFYPPNLVHLLLPPPSAIEASVLLHLFFAGWFMYVYARAIALSRAASLVAGIVYMGSGFMAIQALWFTPALAACVWLPLGLAATDRLCTRREPVWLLLLALAIALPALTGWFQAAAYTGYAIAFYAALRLAFRAARQDGRAHLPFAVVSLAGGVTLGACLAAIQWGPSWELQGLSPRGLGSSEPLTLNVQTPATVFSGIVDPRPGYPRWVYVGILPLLLAPLSFVERRHRERLPALWFLVVLALGVALTVHTPLFGWFQALPGVAWFRSPQRLLFVYSFAMAALAGIGFDALLARLPSPRARLATAFALPALLSCDLFFATRNTEFRPYHDPSVYDREAQLIEFIRKHQGLDRTYMRIGGWRNPAVMHKRGTLGGIYSITDYEPLSLARYEAFYRLMGDPLLPQFTFVGRLLTEPAHRHFALLDLLSVRLLVIHEGNQARRRDLEAAGWRRIFQSPTSRWMIYENPRPLPRAYIAHAARDALSGEEALAILANRSLDFRREVLLEGKGAEALANESGASRPITRAQITRYEPTRVVVEVDAPEPGVLVLTDTFYPGWRAKVDGEPREILRANYLFRGVALDAGRHTVTFTYEPGSFRLGAAVSTIALLAFGAMGAYWLRSRVRDGSH